MGLVQQAVLDFDEEIRVPWRPRLVAVAGGKEPASDALAPDATGPDATWVRRPRPSGRSSSRVGVCRPVEQRSPARDVLQAAAVQTPRPRPEVHRARRPARRRLRLTRRARLLATVVTLALGVAIGSWLGPLLTGREGDLQLAGVQSVVVQPGDTLWSIAQDVAGSADVRGVVDRIQEVNGLHGTVLQPGQVLELP